LPLVDTSTCDANVRYLASTSDGEPARYRIELSWMERGSDTPITVSEELALVAGPSA
jgi:hypothetical protein